MVKDPLPTYIHQQQLNVGSFLILNYLKNVWVGEAYVGLPSFQKVQLNSDVRNVQLAKKERTHQFSLSLKYKIILI
jgi:hypothetical protein